MLLTWLVNMSAYALSTRALNQGHCMHLFEFFDFSEEETNNEIQRNRFAKVNTLNSVCFMTLSATV